MTPGRPLARRRLPWLGKRTGEVNLGDALFHAIAAALGGLVVVLLAAITLDLLHAANATLAASGPGFLVSPEWDPVHGRFGALPFLYGSVVSALLALTIAIPVGVGVAVYMTDYAPARLRAPLALTVELLAAVPGVVYGFWGITVLVPWLRFVQTNVARVAEHVGGMAAVTEPAPGNGLLAAALILALMIVPTISAVSREVITAVPASLREGAQALGATTSEMLRKVVLPYARAGVVGAILLGLGRALCETMAVTMVIGNRPAISASLFAPAATMASVIATQYGEAQGSHLGALSTLGLVLLALTVLLNVAARLLVTRVGAAGNRP